MVRVARLTPRRPARRAFPIRRTFILLLAFVSWLAPAHAARTHVVRRGETLSSIAADYGVSVKTLARANKLRDADYVRLGQKLEIPDPPGVFVKHEVERGETLVSIASEYQVSVADIRAHNDLPDPDLLLPGQILLIPGPGRPVRAPSPPARTPAPRPSAHRTPRHPVVSAAVQRAIDRAPVKPGRWKHLVVHHSGTRTGSGPSMDRYHREERGMENGLAYHFVIGNGHGMGDGEIFIGNRWTRQLDGGHLAIPELNANSLGICLVGDFQKGYPTHRQLDSLEALLRALMKRTGLGPDAFTTHRLIHPHHTLCPGKHFPTEAFRKRLRN